MPFEKLDRSLVLFSRHTCLESTEIAPLSGLRLFLAGI
jgi:hypothetical protein